MMAFYSSCFGAPWVLGGDPHRLGVALGDVVWGADLRARHEHR